MTLNSSIPSISLQFHPLTPARWPDFENLFGPRGAVGGCWCMVWRLKRSEFEKHKGERNKQALQTVVNAGQPVGILAYNGAEAIAWCALAPRAAYSALGRSRILKPVDDKPVWSISCLFIRKGFRRQGVSLQLIKAAVDYAKMQGATIIEAYPIDPKKDSMPTVFAWTGFISAYQQAGFVEVLRRSETRPIMRYFVTQRVLER